MDDVRYLSARLRRLAAQLPHLPRAFSLVWTAARHWTIAWIALLGIHGLLPVAIVYLIRSVVDAFLAAVLGRCFANGSELSTGEWQRIALARAFLWKAPLLILDEPTSAMGPWAETDWLRRLHKLGAGRTAVVITHRFTTAIIADSIYLMDEGRVKQHGTHEELLSAGHRHAEGWLGQATMKS